MTKDNSTIKNGNVINKFINAYLVSTGFFGLFFISFSYLGDPEIRKYYGIFDLIFMTLYSIMLFYGVQGWRKKTIPIQSKILLYLQLISASIFSFSFLFSGIIDSYLSLTLKPFFSVGFEFDTGIRYRFIYDAPHEEITIGINLVVLIFLVLIIYNEKK